MTIWPGRHGNTARHNPHFIILAKLEENYGSGLRFDFLNTRLLKFNGGKKRKIFRQNN